MLVPLLIEEKLKSWFGFPEKKIHAQVATLFENKPHIRTMLLLEITQQGELIFLTHKKTQKWVDLKAFPHIAITLVHLEFGQLTVEGIAHIEAKENPKIQEYWKSLLPSIQRIYTPSPEETAPESFGIIRVDPTSWEILELNKKEYTKSFREQFFIKNRVVQSKRLDPL